MWAVERSSSGHYVTGAIVALSLFIFSRAAAGQAFIPAAGDGTVSVSYQAAFTRGQLNSSGQLLSPPGSDVIDTTDAHSLIWQVEYGLTDRVAVHTSLPFSTVRYEGPFPHPIGIKLQPSNIDDGAYHGSFQDFYFGARFKLMQSPRFALTPFAEAIIPSHHYESLGQAVVGRDLRALVVGAAIGGFAEDVLPGLFFQTRLSYAMVQQVLDIRPNRTGVDTAVGYFVTPRLAIQFVQTLQLTHDGVDFAGTSPDLTVPGGTSASPLQLFLNHDRLLRSNVLNLGGGLTFAITDQVGIFVTATTMAWGENIQRPRSVTVGMNWSFQTRRGASVRQNLTGVLPLQ